MQLYNGLRVIFKFIFFRLLKRERDPEALGYSVLTAQRIKTL